MSAHDPKPAHDDNSDLPFAPTLRKTIIILLVGFATPVIVLLLLVHFISAGAPSEANSTVATDSATTAPVGQVAVASAASNAATMSAATASAATASAASAPSTAPAAATTTADAGQALYTSTCIACHGAGIAGAPKLGDKAAWAPRIAQGVAVLDDHAIHGFQGKAGMMPPKGGSTASDDDVKAAVAYMVAQSK